MSGNPEDNGSESSGNEDDDADNQDLGNNDSEDLDNEDNNVNESSEDDWTDDDDDDDDGQGEDEDDNDEESADPVHRLLNNPLSHEAPSMWLNAQEKAWANELKDALESSPHHQMMNDMWIAQYALISEGDVANALKRIGVLQVFKKEYEIDDSPEQGLQWLAAFLDLIPGFFLCLDVDAATLEGLHVVDGGKVNPTAIMEDDYTWKTYILGHYYYFYIAQPTLATVRNGQYAMVDFGSFDWHNIRWEIWSRLNEEFLRFYPIKYSNLLAFNTNTVTNIFYSMTRHVFPKAMMDKVQLGCKVPVSEMDEYPRSLTEMHMQPSMDAAHERMLLRAKDLLLLRAKNEANYRL